MLLELRTTRYSKEVLLRYYGINLLYANTLLKDMLYSSLQ